MDNLYQLDNSDQRMEQASLWIAKIDRGLTETESAELEEWLVANPTNQQLLLEMAEVWDKSAVMSRLAAMFPRESEKPARQWGVANLSIAASIAVMIIAGLGGLSGLLLFDHFDTNHTEYSLHTEVYETTIGNQSSTELSDGSKLHLNTNTLVRTAYSSSARTIYLERGEININVRPDSARPLSVIAGGRIFRAVGTMFSVKLNDAEEVELIVSHGKVLVGINEPANEVPVKKLPAPLPLSAEVDEGLMVGKGGYVILGEASVQVETLTSDELAAQLSWSEGNLVFRGESLSEIVMEISRYTTLEFVFVDESIKAIQVAGLFKAGDVSGFLSTLQSNFDIVYERVDDKQVLLKSKSM